MSGYTFTSKVDTLHYLFSGVDERFLESKTCTEESELHVSWFFYNHFMFSYVLKLRYASLIVTCRDHTPGFLVVG